MRNFDSHRCHSPSTFCFLFFGGNWTLAFLAFNNKKQVERQPRSVRTSEDAFKQPEIHFWGGRYPTLTMPLSPENLLPGLHWCRRSRRPVPLQRRVARGRGEGLRGRGHLGVPALHWVPGSARMLLLARAVVVVA